MAKTKARKSDTLVCVPCGYGVTISDLGGAVVECYECGVALVPEKPAAARKLITAKKAAPAGKAAAKRKAAPKKTAPKRAAAKKK